MRWGNHRTCAVAAVAAVGAGTETRGQIELSRQTEQAQLTCIHEPHAATIPGNSEWMTGGIGVGDFDRDGLPDLFVTNGGGGPDVLYMNQGDGTFTDKATAWGLTAVHCGNGVAVGDYDGDGWLDIYVTSFGTPPIAAPGQHRLYRNNGGTSFTNVAQLAGVHAVASTTPQPMGAAFGDYDLDGDLDLAVVSWTLSGSGNRLFRNNGNGTFSDATATALPPGSLSGVWGFQPAFADMNDDRWPELLIAADFEASRYFANGGNGRFINLTVPSGTGLDDNGMGQTVGDFDNDGRLDWYVTSIHKDFPQPDDNVGNMHYRAIGVHQFAEISARAGTNDGGWGWGTVAVDLDQDGWLEIAEVNGREGSNEWHAEPAKLFYNLRNNSFVEVAAASGFDHAGSGRAIVWLDVEGDGDLDLLVVTNNVGIDLYRNETEAIGHWLQLSFDTSANPLLAPDGFGTRVTATASGLTQVRQVDSAPSYLGTSEIMVHFGLGEAVIVDEILIQWPRGQETLLLGVAADQHLVLVAPIPADVTADGAVDVNDLVAVILGWGPCRTNPCAADTNADGAINVDDLVAVILGWG